MALGSAIRPSAACCADAHPLVRPSQDVDERPNGDVSAAFLPLLRGDPVGDRIRLGLRRPSEGVECISSGPTHRGRATRSCVRRRPPPRRHPNVPVTEERYEGPHCPGVSDPTKCPGRLSANEVVVSPLQGLDQRLHRGWPDLCQRLGGVLVLPAELGDERLHCRRSDSDEGLACAPSNCLDLVVKTLDQAWDRPGLSALAPLLPGDAVRDPLAFAVRDPPEEVEPRGGGLADGRLAFFESADQRLHGAHPRSGQVP